MYVLVAASVWWNVQPSITEITTTHRHVVEQAIATSATKFSQVRIVSAPVPRLGWNMEVVFVTRFAGPNGQCRTLKECVQQLDRGQP